MTLMSARSGESGERRPLLFSIACRIPGPPALTRPGGNAGQGLR